MPFHNLRDDELAVRVLGGQLPAKPRNAPALGLSEALWNFVQLCWDKDITRRPPAAEVVRHVREASEGWHTLMPTGGEPGGTPSRLPISPSPEGSPGAILQIVKGCDSDGKPRASVILQLRYHGESSY